MKNELEKIDTDSDEYWEAKFKNEKIRLREKCRHLRPITRKDILRAKSEVLRKRFLRTEYTGLIKSTKDLAYWARVPDWKHRCRRCGKGQNEYGLCLACRKVLDGEGRCFECFDIIVNKDQGSWAMLRTGTSTCCTTCLNKSYLTHGNSHGYKEGGSKSGGLRTNYWIDNQNDDNAKINEET